MGRLRQNNDATELPEMLIEGEGRGNAERLHHDPARAIGEAPILVREPEEDLKRRPDIGFGEKIERRQFTA